MIRFNSNKVQSVDIGRGPDIQRIRAVRETLHQVQKAALTIRPGSSLADAMNSTPSREGSGFSVIA